MRKVRHSCLIAALLVITSGYSLPANASVPVDDITSVIDVTGDGVPDIVGFADNGTGRPGIAIYSGATGDIQSTADYINDKWRGYALATVRDADQDGIADDPAVSMLTVNKTTQKIRVETRRLDTNAFLGSIQFLSETWRAVDVVVVDDLNGDGISNDTAIAVLAERFSDGRVMVQLRDLASGALIANVVYLNAQWTPIAAAVADRSAMAPVGTLPPLIGVIAENASNGKRVLQAREAGSGTLDRNIKVLGATWHYLDVSVNPDANGDGVLDDPLWLVLAVRPSDQVIRVQSRFVSDGSFDANIVILNTNWEGLRLDVAPDVNGNLAHELVISAARRSNATRRIHIKDFASRNTTINIAQPPLPPQLAGIDLSDTALVLDRWGDTATVTAQGIDQFGDPINGATLTWSSTDDTIADVDGSGNVSTWLGGDAQLTAEASLDGITVNGAVTITVAIQRNVNCTVPTEFPVQGPVNPPSTWDVRSLQTQFIADGTSENVWIGRQITLDVDRDGDPDVISHVHTPWFQGIGVPIYTGYRVWLNDGNGFFTDGTDAILGENVIPWASPRNMGYADLDADGFRDVAVFQQGHEFHQNACGNGPGSCPGAPNLLLLPQPDGLSDSAPTRLSPYDMNGFTHSGAVGDIDCDGDIDIFEAQWGSSEADAPHRMQLNSGVGTFQADNSLLPDEMLPDISIAATALCDLDRDGDLDLINSFPGTATPYIPPGFTADYAIRISVNNGFGQFRMLNDEVLPPLTPGHGMYCADLDLDGYNDLVPSQGESMVVIRNLGDMAFTDATSTMLPPDPLSLPANGLGIVDRNGDGWPDMNSDKDMAIYWNTGAGIFSRTTLPGVVSGSQTTIADFDLNGRPDVYHHRAKNMQTANRLFLNYASPAPTKLVFATSGLFTADLGGLAGADAICQQHADSAGLQGSFVAYLSDSSTDAINRLSHGEYHRTGDNALVAQSKLGLLRPTPLVVAIANDEHGVLIPGTSNFAHTGTNRDGEKREDAGVGFCSDWTRATNEDPGLAASGWVGVTNNRWVWNDDVNCSEPQHLYCFQQ